MSQTPINDELRRAYNKVGLLANNVWNYNEKDTHFQKANLNLWVRFNEVEQTLVEEESEDGQSTSTDEVPVARTVRDTIPFSRLASYNDYAYNEERESMYVKDEEPAEYIPACNQIGEKNLEVWMLPEVEEEFKRLTCVTSSKWNTVSPRESVQDTEVTVTPLTPASQLTKTDPNQWLTSTRWLDQLLTRYPDLPNTIQDTKSHSLFKEDSMMPKYSEEDLKEKLEEFPCPRYSIDTNEELKLHMKINSDRVRCLWANKESSYGGYRPRYRLNVHVPEFQPSPLRGFGKAENQFQVPSNLLLSQSQTQTRVELQQYPPIYDANYEAEVYPYSKIQDQTNTNFLFHHTVGTPIGYSDEEKLLYNIPVFAEPPASYFNIEQEGRDVGNFASNPVSEQASFFLGTPGLERPQQSLLTAVLATIPSYNLPMFNIRNPQEVLDFLEKQLSRIYNSRVDDLKAIYSASKRIAKAFQNAQQSYCLIQEPPNTFRTPQKSLYSDVLVNAKTLCNNDTKYDQLEQEALEQYSGSDTMLLANLSSPRVEPEVSNQNSGEDVKENTKLFSEIQESCGYEERPLLKSKSKRRIRLTNTLPNRSISSSTSPKSAKLNKLLIGYKRCFAVNTDDGPPTPSKQAMLVERVKKLKKEKKKKYAKRDNKQQFGQADQTQSIENEIEQMKTFIGHSNNFLISFFKNDWKPVLNSLEQEVMKPISDCFDMIKECVLWLEFLFKSKELKKNVFINTKRLDIIVRVNGELDQLFQLLIQYFFLYREIKYKVPVYPGIFIQENKCRKAILAGDVYVVSNRQVFHGENLEGKYNHPKTNKTVEKLMKFAYFTEDFLASANCEWILKICTSEQNQTLSCMKSTGSWVQPFKHEGSLNIALDSKKFKNCEASIFGTKLIKIIDNSSIWTSLQWKFIDYCVVQNVDSRNFNSWLNKFNANSLEYYASHARMIFVIDNWISYSTKAIFFKKNSLKSELLWDSNGFELISSRMILMRVLLKEEDKKAWYFGNMRVSKQPCNNWQLFCDNCCCVSWSINSTQNHTKEKKLVKLKNVKNSLTQRVNEEEMSSSNSSKKKEREAKKKEESLPLKNKASKKLSPKRQVSFKKNVSNEYKEPDNNCILQ